VKRRTAPSTGNFERKRRSHSHQALFETGEFGGRLSSEADQNDQQKGTGSRRLGYKGIKKREYENREYVRI